MKVKMTKTDEKKVIENDLDNESNNESNESQELIPNLPEIITYPEAAKEYIKFVVPFSVARMMSSVSDMLCSIFLAQKNPSYLAASGLMSVYRYFVTNTGFTSLYSTGSIASRELATKKDENIGKVLKASYMYALLLSVPAIALVCASGPILKVAGQDEEVADIVQEYFQAYAPGIPAIFMSVSSQQTAYALNHNYLILAITTLRRAIQVGVTYGLLNGIGSIPPQGAASAGYANTIAAWVDVAFFMGYFLLHKDLKKYNLMKLDFHEIGKYLKDISKKSLLIAAQTFNEYFATFVGTSLIGLKGIVPLSAAEITTQYDSLIRVQELSCAQSAAILVGRKAKLTSQHHPDSARRMGNVAMILSLAVPLAIIPICIVIPNLLAKPFMDTNNSNAEEIVKITKDLLLINSLSHIPNTLRTVASGSLRGFDDYLYSTLMSILTMSIIALGVGYLLSFHSVLDINGIFLGYAIGMTLGWGAMLPRWLSISKPQDTLNNVAIHAAQEKEYAINSAEPNQQDNSMLLDETQRKTNHSSSRWSCISSFFKAKPAVNEELILKQENARRCTIL